jgi:SAM-dependent methyltransferase
MRDTALPLLACPHCAGSLTLAPGAERADDGHVMTGLLRCAGCDAKLDVVRGVPRLAPGQRVDPEATRTAARFGEQWKTFAHMSTYQEEWLRAWLDPVGPERFRGKVVLEGGCGKGRHSVVASGWGAKALVSLDLGDAVDVAFEHTRHLDNVHIVQADILHPPVPRVFDLAFSVGVLHHLPDPRGGFDQLAERVKPGGTIAIWVYGRENNEWIVRFVDPVRTRVTSRLPHKLLYAASLPPSAILKGALSLYKNDKLSKRLPYRAYLKKLAALPLREVHNIVYDQLVTPIAFYLPESEVRSWFEGPRFRDVTVGWHNQNSWRASATVT